MTAFFEWCGFAGAWLLFAGPILQAENELDGEAREISDFEQALKTVPRPPTVSPWWWLLPPVALVLHRLRARTLRRQLQSVVSAQQMAQLVKFKQTATGWWLVAGGACLIAIKETSALTEHYEWPAAVLWPLIAFMIVASILFTVARARRRDDILAR